MRSSLIRTSALYMVGRPPPGSRLDSAESLSIPAGENNKTRESWGWLTDQLIERDLDAIRRSSLLGGGMVGDLAGFVAATFMRGIPVVHVPTSFLAMIDASIGGKTGVDTHAGKNLVGAFHPPAGRSLTRKLLATLPLRLFENGICRSA